VRRRRPATEGPAPGLAPAAAQQGARSRESAYSTGHADVDALLDCLGRHIRALLGAKLLGLYLTGSLVTGDFDPLVSDVDLLAVTSVGLSRRDVEGLAAMHAALAAQEPHWENRIEVAYPPMCVGSTCGEPARKVTALVTLGSVSPVSTRSAVQEGTSGTNARWPVAASARAMRRTPA
jgi:hypothetical protein